MDSDRCTAEMWCDGSRYIGPHWARCTQDAGHEGHHCVMTEFWGVVWPDEAAMRLRGEDQSSASSDAGIPSIKLERP